MTDVTDPQARAWFLFAQFHVAEHTRLANSDTDQLFPEYVREVFAAREKYLDRRIKGLHLITYSMPTTISSLQNRGIVPVDAIFHGSHLVSQSTVAAVFAGIAGLTTIWGALCYGHGEIWPSLNEHAAFIAFLRGSSRGGIDPTLMIRVDFRGDSEAVQPVLRREEKQVKAWKFEAAIDAAFHPALIDVLGEISSDYFRLQILHRIKNWEELKKVWDLVSYSVQRYTLSSHTKGPVSVLGIFRNVHSQRRTAVEGIFSGIPGLTVKWTAIDVSRGGTLASNAEYQEYLAASTKDSMNQDPKLRIRVDVNGSTDAPPKKG